MTGTIAGLVVGNNDGNGLTVEVLSSPSGNVHGGGWGFVTAGSGTIAFTVLIDFSMSYANAAYARASGVEQLFLGGYGGSFPQLFYVVEGESADHSNSDGRTAFELVTDVPAVPLPAGLPLLLAGLGGVASAGGPRGLIHAPCA